MRELATPAPAGAAAVPATTPTRATALTPSPTPRAALYYPLFSFKQAALHPSPSTVLPSSHSSPVSTTPLPQLIWQLVHPSLDELLEVEAEEFPLSHCSFTLFFIPSPQNSIMQLAEQPSPLTRLPSSHYSPVLRVLSPQDPVVLPCSNLERTNIGL